MYPHVKIQFEEYLTKYFYGVLTYQITEHLFLIDYIVDDNLIKDSFPLSDIREIILVKRIYGQRKEDK